jgi:hypothetical protein
MTYYTHTRPTRAFNGLGATPLRTITTDTIEAFFGHLRSATTDRGSARDRVSPWRLFREESNRWADAMCI